MRVLITACTERAFSKGLMPMAHLTLDEVCAVNDNKRRGAVWAVIYPRQQPRRVLRQRANQALQTAL
jgi:hypothetical protein